MDLQYCGAVCDETVVEILKSLPLISDLNLFGCFLVSEKAFENIPENIPLEKLNLRVCTGIVDHTALLSSLSKLKHLKELQLDSTIRRDFRKEEEEEDYDDFSGKSNPFKEIEKASFASALAEYRQSHPTVSITIHEDLLDIYCWIGVFFGCNSISAGENRLHFLR